MADLLKGKVAVIPGSGQGVGRSIAIALAKEGAKVVTNNRVQGGTRWVHLEDRHYNALTPEQRDWLDALTKQYAGDAASTAKTINEMGGEAVPFYGDIADYETAGKLIQTAVDRFGKIDILVNVAGAFGFSKIWEMPESLWDKVNEIKPKGYFNTIRQVLPLMMQQKWGRIINCTSQAWAGDPLSHAEYATANAGVVGLTRAVASEVFPWGITCNAFSPFALTRASFELISYNQAVNPGGFAPPLDSTPSSDGVGPMIVYLASDRAAKISGTIFSISGKSVGIFSDPVIRKSIEPSAGEWTLDEIMTKTDDLFDGYETHVMKKF